jgi:hypothetical protein
LLREDIKRPSEFLLWTEPRQTILSWMERPIFVPAEVAKSDDRISVTQYATRQLIVAGLSGRRPSSQNSRTNAYQITSQDKIQQYPDKTRRRSGPGTAQDCRGYRRMGKEEQNHAVGGSVAVTRSGAKNGIQDTRIRQAFRKRSPGLSSMLLCQSTAIAALPPLESLSLVEGRVLGNAR